MNVWNTIEELHKNYEPLDLSKTVVDYESLKSYSLLAASTILEGSII